MKHSPLVLSLIGFALVVIQATSQGKGTYAGFIKQIGGTVELQRNGEPRTLDPEKDVFLELTSNDHLRARDNGWLNIVHADGVMKRWSQPRWTQLKGVDSNPGNPHFQRIHHLFTKTFGRLLSQHIGFYSPANGSKIRRSDLKTLHWNPPKDATLMELRIQMGQTGVGDFIDSSTGSYELGQEQLDAIMKALDTSPTLSPSIVITLTAESGASAESRVQFLSAEEERLMNAELRSFDDETDTVLATLGRAAVFEHYGLLNQSIEALDSVASSNPGTSSLPLLSLLHERLLSIRNHTAAAAVKDRIKKLNATPALP